MISILLRAGAPYIMFLQGILSIFFLLRGHNLPGGGFIAGLLMSCSFILYAIAYDARKAQNLLRIQPETLVSIGLSIALMSSLISLFLQHPYMTGIWAGHVIIPFLGKVAIGTPFLFDVGVYLTVMGMTLLVVFTFFEATGKTKSRR